MGEERVDNLNSAVGMLQRAYDVYTKMVKGADGKLLKILPEKCLRKASVVKGDADSYARWKEGTAVDAYVALVRKVDADFGNVKNATTEGGVATSPADLTWIISVAAVLLFYELFSEIKDNGTDEEKAAFERLSTTEYASLFDDDVEKRLLGYTKLSDIGAHFSRLHSLLVALKEEGTLTDAEKEIIRKYNEIVRRGVVGDLKAESTDALFTKLLLFTVYVGRLKGKGLEDKKELSVSDKSSLSLTKSGLKKALCELFPEYLPANCNEKLSDSSLSMLQSTSGDVGHVLRVMFGVTGAAVSNADVEKMLIEALRNKAMAVMGLSEVYDLAVPAEYKGKERGTEEYRIYRAYRRKVESSGEHDIDNIMSILGGMYRSALAVRPFGMLALDEDSNFDVFTLEVTKDEKGGVTDVEAVTAVKYLNKHSEVYQGLLRELQGYKAGAKQEGILDGSTPIADMTSIFTELASMGSASTYVPLFHLPYIYGYYKKDGIWCYSRKYEDMVGSIKQEVAKYVRMCYTYADNTGKDAAEWLEPLKTRFTNFFLIQHWDVNSTLECYLRFANVGVTSQQIVDFFNQSLANAAVCSRLYKNEDARWLTPPVGKTVIQFKLVYSFEKYLSEVLFAYKAIENLAEQGKRCDFSNIVLGRKLSGEDTCIDLEKADHMLASVIGASGSGKGVMTLSILGTAIATKHPFLYLDNKPDMACILWEAERQFNKALQAAGRKTAIRILAVDVFQDPDVANPNRTYEPVRKPKWGYNYDKFADLFHLTDTERGGMKGSAARLCAITKMVQIGIMWGLSKPNSDANKLLFVADEINSMWQLYKTGGVLTDIGSKLLPIKEAYKKAADVSERKSIESEWERAYRFCNILGVGLSNNSISSLHTALVYGGNLADALRDVRRTTARAQNAILFLTIGQSTIFEEVPKNGETWIQQSIASAVVKMYGNADTAEEGQKLIKKDLVDSEYISKTPRNLEKKKQDLNGDVDLRGFFAVETPNSLVVTKSFLTLNENDADKPLEERRYTGGLCKKRSEEWIENELFNPDGSLNEKVGFIGYIKCIAEKINPDIDAQTAVLDMMESCGLGYEYVSQWFSDSGLQSAFGYDCVEDWIYDMDPDTFFTCEELVAGHIMKPDHSVPVSANTPAGQANGIQSTGVIVLPNGVSETGVNSYAAVEDSDSTDFGYESGLSLSDEVDLDEDDVVLDLDDEDESDVEASVEASVEGELEVPPQNNRGTQAQPQMQTQQGVRGIASVSVPVVNRAAEANVFTGESVTTPLHITQGEQDSLIEYAQRDKVNSSICFAKSISSKLMSLIAEEFGGLKAVRKLYIDKLGHIYIEGILVAPAFPVAMVQYLPRQYQLYVKQNNMAEFFLYSQLVKFKGLKTLVIEDVSLAEEKVRPETGMGKAKSWLWLKNKLGLDVLSIGGQNIGDEVSEQEYEQGAYKGYSLKDKIVGALSGVSSFVSDSNANSPFRKLWNTRPVKAVTTALGWTLGLQAVLWGASIFGPLGLFFGAVAGVSAVSGLRSKDKDNKEKQ